jgi:rhodanese-related sulfurtransferase
MLLFFILSSVYVLPLSAQEANGEKSRLLSPEEFYVKMKSADVPLILDTRTWKEYRKDRIPEARLTESSVILRSVVDSLDKEYPIFVYCDDNQRSTTACEFLRDWGYTNVYELAGGMIAWKLASYEVDTEKLNKKN